MKIYLDNNLGVKNVEQEELTQDTIGYNILKVYIPNAVLTPYDTFTCYYGALLQNGRKVGWFAMEARTSSDADYEANYTLYKATLEQCVVSVEGKVYIGCQVLLGNSGNATLIKKNTAVVQFNVRKSVAINNDILVLDTDQTTTDVLESYKNLLENALTTYATKATTYTKTEVDSALALKADKSNTYTKAEVYTKTEVDGKLDLKADKSDTYTKAQVDSALATKADRDATDSRFLLVESAIDDLTSVQNVVEVVATKSALNSYDTTKLDADDKVQVIADETHDGASTIYNWNGSAWQYVGAYGTNAAPKSTAITHTGNQLQDYSGNNIYPNTYFSKILAELNTWITATNVVDLNDYVNNNVILFGGFHASSTHLPSGIDKAKNYIMEVRRNNFSSASVYNVTQTLYSVNNSRINMYVRSYATTSNAWSDWATIEFDVYFDTIKSKNNTWIVSNSVVDLNDYTTNNILMFGGFNNSSQNLPSGIDKSQQYLFKSFRNNYTSSSTYTVSQELVMLTGTYTIIYTRNYASVNNTWSSWIKTDKEIYYDTIVPKDYTWIVSSQTVNLNDYNNFNMIVFGGFNNNSTNLPNGIDKSKNYLLKVSRGIYHPNQKYLIVQELIGIDTPITYTRHFENINNAWTSWISPAKTRTQISITSSSDFITQMNNAYSLGDCDVYISIGTFDMTSLIETYYNKNQYGARSRFIQLGNNCKYYFSANTHLIAEYDGDNSTLMLNFSMFNCDGTDFELNGLNASCKNLRYVIHDDPSSKHDDVGYTHIYNNCILELDNTNNHNINYMDTIGGGVGANSTIIVNGGRYKSIPNPSNTYPTRDFAYHSYGTSYYDYEFTDNFYITNVYFENTFAIGKIKTTDYGNLYCQASNNSMGHTAYAGTGTSHGAGYATLVLWNNEVRS